MRPSEPPPSQPSGSPRLRSSVVARHRAALRLPAMTDRPPCHCSCANVFSSREAENDLKRYTKNGPDSSTKALVGAILAEGVDGATLLDIGAGIGAIQLELLPLGLAHAE